MQGNLFDEVEPEAPASVAPTALQTWYLTPPCAHGRRCFNTSPVFAVGWSGPHHCDACNADVEEGCRAFAEAVRAGKYDEYGYTPAERRLLAKRNPNFRPRLRLIGTEADR